MANQNSMPVFDPGWNARRWLAGGGMTACVLGILALISYYSLDRNLSWAVGVFWGGLICGGAFFYVDFIAKLRQDTEEQIRNASKFRWLSIILPVSSVGGFTTGLIFATSHFQSSDKEAAWLTLGILAFCGIVVIALNLLINSVITTPQKNQNAETYDPANGSTKRQQKPARNRKRAQTSTPAK